MVGEGADECVLTQETGSHFYCCLPAVPPSIQPPRGQRAYTIQARPARVATVRGQPGWIHMTVPFPSLNEDAPPLIQVLFRTGKLAPETPRERASQPFLQQHRVIVLDVTLRIPLAFHPV